MDSFESITLPLTKSQTSLWLVDKLNPNIPINNVPYAFYIKGDIDEKVFQSAFQELINTTDVLRAVIVEVDSMPNQKIRAFFEFKLEYLDFSNQESLTIESWLQTRSETPFDLSQQLFDTILLKKSTEEFIWFFNVHHVITDASSSVILFESMSKIYESLKRGTNDAQVEKLGYKVFVDFELKERVNNEDITKYWEDKVETFNEIAPLYGFKKIQAVTTKSNRTEIELHIDKVKQLINNSNQGGAMLWNEDLIAFNVFAALLFTYMYRISGQKRLMVGAPIHNRVKKSFKTIAGLFIEILPLTVEIDEDDTFKSLLKKVQIETNNYLKYGVTGTSSEKSSRSFNTLFNYINSSFSAFSGYETRAEWIHPGHSAPAHKLSFHVCDFNATGNLKLILDVNDDVLSESKLGTAAIHFKNIVNAFLSDINQPITKTGIATKNEVNAYLKHNLVSVDEILNILKVFENLVKQKPNTVVVESNNETFTYKTLNKKANQLANYLIKKGIGPGESVALYNYRNSQYIIGVLAIMKAGGTFIPIASDQPEERVAYIISNSGCSLVLTEGLLQDNISNIDVPYLDLATIKDEVKKESEVNPDADLSLNSLAYVMYTSGSTGNPKGVLISHGALSNYIFWAKDYYDITENTILPLFTSIGFDLTITSTLLPLISGGKLMLYPENAFGLDISLMQVLGDNSVNTIKLTPSHLSFLKDRDLSNSNIHTMIVGGEDFKVSLAQAITSAFNKLIKIYNEYGPTEATVGCIVGLFDKEKHRDDVSVAIGVPIKNMHAYILDENKNLVPDGVAGELYLSGSSLANGYLKLEELTNNKFVDNPFVQGTKMYHTGDLARISQKGEYEYLGRVDEQIKLRGYRIELTDIEANLINFKDIDDCAVVLVKNKYIDKSEVKRIRKEIRHKESDSFEDDEKLVVYYTGNNELSHKELKQYLSQKVPSYMVPSVFKHLEEMPLTKNGKTDKKTLRSLKVDPVETQVSFITPINEIEELVEGALKEGLRMEKIGVQEIDTISLITETEISKIKSWNNTAVDYPKDETLLSKFEKQVLKTPNQVAVIFEELSITYQELDEKSNQVVRFLIQKGIQNNDIVAVSLDRSLEMMIYIYGIIKAGAAYLPIAPDLPTERLKFIIKDANSKILFYNHNNLENSVLNTVDCFKIETLEQQVSLLDVTSNSIGSQPDDLAYIIYTSGSTGEPKGVKCHHEGICNRLNWMNNDYPISTLDTFIQKTPITFDVSVWELFWPLQEGAKLVVEVPNGHMNPNGLIESIKRHQVTNIHFVPSMLNLFIQTEGFENCHSLNRVFCSGEALSVPVVEKAYEKLDVEVFNLYGPTEASVDVTSWHCKKEELSKGIPIGKPVANTQLYILDEKLNLLPIGLKGELYIAGKQVAKGYLNRETLTNERFIKDVFSDDLNAKMYKTGDLARYRDDGVIEYHGRIDNQIKLRGLRIELGEIEKNIEKITSITQAIVKVDGQDNLVAYYTGEKTVESKIISKLEQQLPQYMIPQFYMHLEHFELLSSGKVNRKKLPLHDTLVKVQNIEIKIAPRNEIEEIVHDVWKEVIGIEQIGVHENFLRIGGNSLSAISITSRLKAMLELDVSITDVFNYPSIAAYAENVERVITELLDN